MLWRAVWCSQVTPLTKEHSKEVADIFDPAKAARRTAAEANAVLSETSGQPAELRPVDGVYALGDCCANMGKPQIHACIRVPPVVVRLL